MRPILPYIVLSLRFVGCSDSTDVPEPKHHDAVIRVAGATEELAVLEQIMQTADAPRSNNFVYSDIGIGDPWIDVEITVWDDPNLHDVVILTDWDWSAFSSSRMGN